MSAKATKKEITIKFDTAEKQDMADVIFRKKTGIMGQIQKQFDNIRFEKIPGNSAPITEVKFHGTDAQETLLNAFFDQLVVHRKTEGLSNTQVSIVAKAVKEKAAPSATASFQKAIAVTVDEPYAFESPKAQEMAHQIFRQNSRLGLSIQNIFKVKFDNVPGGEVPIEWVTVAGTPAKVAKVKAFMPALEAHFKPGKELSILDVREVLATVDKSISISKRELDTAKAEEIQAANDQSGPKGQQDLTFKDKDAKPVHRATIDISSQPNTQKAAYNIFVDTPVGKGTAANHIKGRLQVGLALSAEIDGEMKQNVTPSSLKIDKKAEDQEKEKDFAIKHVMLSSDDKDKLAVAEKIFRHLINEGKTRNHEGLRAILSSSYIDDAIDEIRGKKNPSVRFDIAARRPAPQIVAPARAVTPLITHGTLDFNFDHIKPRTQDQQTALRSIMLNTFVNIFGEAGSGKTRIAAGYGMSLLMKNQIRKLVISRNVLESGGNKMGFLPGDAIDKTRPYLQPIYDMIDDMLGGQNAWQSLVEKGRLEIAPLNFIRGRTFENAVVILDEATCATDQQIFDLMTRIGASNSKLILTGDPIQSDLPVQDRGGMLGWARQLVGKQDFGVAYLDAKNIQRHPMIKDIIAIQKEKMKWEDHSQEIKALALQSFKKDEQKLMGHSKVAYMTPR